MREGLIVSAALFLGELMGALVQLPRHLERFLLRTPEARQESCEFLLGHEAREDARPPIRLLAGRGDDFDALDLHALQRLAHLTPAGPTNGSVADRFKNIHSLDEFAEGRVLPIQ